jgi:hypothetical protein
MGSESIFSLKLSICSLKYGNVFASKDRGRSQLPASRRVASYVAKFMNRST